MLRSGILNPYILSLLARTRHTNRIVVADRGFPSWQELETIDLSLTDGIPTVLDVLRAIAPVWQFGAVRMAAQFQHHNTPSLQAEFAEVLHGTNIHFEEHTLFKAWVPGALGLIRTGDTAPYSNVILESA